MTRSTGEWWTLGFLLLFACRESGAPVPEQTPRGIAEGAATSPARPADAEASVAVPMPMPMPAPAAAPDAAASAARVQNFDTLAAGPVAGMQSLRTGPGADGRFVVVAVADAPSKPNVLRQTDTDMTDGRFAVAVLPEPMPPDVRVSVSCRPISGNVDRACGLVLRLAGANDYYVARANALEDNVRFYYVKNGRRVQLSSWSGKVASKQWHTLRVDAKGDLFEVYFDGARVMSVHDATFAAGGKVGVWTKADSVTEYDDLTVGAL